MSLTTTVKVSKRYQIAVPALARQRLNIRSGDRLLVDIQDGMLIILPEPQSYSAALAGLHQEIWNGVDALQYVREERQATKI